MNNRGSLTLESALVLPIFCLVLWSCLSLFSLMEFQLKVQQAMAYTCSRGNLTSDLPILNAVWYQKMFEEEWQANGGQLENIFQLSCEFEEDDWLILTLRYTVRLPGIAFSLPCQQVYRKRLWSGSSGSREEKHYVYVTENYSVYHTFLDCSYLQTKMIGVVYDKLENYQTKEGEAYVPCAVCAGGNHGSVVYITLGGTVWHNTLECYTLTRSIRRLQLQEVEGMAQCSRCLARQIREE